MIKMITKKTNNKKGFTLIELIVVIAILGILAAIAIPRLGAFRGDAVIKSHNANVRTIESAAMVYVADKGNPTSGNTYGKTEIETNMQVWPKVPTGLTVVTGEPAVGEDYSVSVSDTGVITVLPAKK